MFQFGRLALLAEWYIFNVPGCPIRKSSDITLVCSSPKLIAAYHVLHRLSDPRHPPYALNCFKNLRYILCESPHGINLLLVLQLIISQYVKELNQCANMQMCRCANEDADNADLNHLLPIELPNVWKELFNLLISWCANVLMKCNVEGIEPYLPPAGYI